MRSRASFSPWAMRGQFLFLVGGEQRGSLISRDTSSNGFCTIAETLLGRGSVLAHRNPANQKEDTGVSGGLITRPMACWNAGQPAGLPRYRTPFGAEFQINPRESTVSR